MEGCEQCIMSAQAQHQQYSTTIEKAKQYARENHKQVAIYKEGYAFAFIDAEIAIAGNYPIQEFITEHS